MKVIIECETAFEARRALGGMDAWLVLRRLDELMRQCIRRGDHPDQITHQWRQSLHELCDDYRVDLDDDEQVTQ